MRREHTDYNEGFVFPLALENRTYIVGTGEISDDHDKCNIVSMNMGKEVVTFKANSSLAPGEPFWANYVKVRGENEPTATAETSSNRESMSVVLCFVHI
jgi:galactokinase